MPMLKWVAILLAGYVAFAALLYVMQRAMMYFPDPARVAPAEAGFVSAEELELATADGERVVVWHVPPRDGRPVVLYFHGNGGNLSYRVPRFRALTADGLGIFALSYRGYGGSTGAPSEAGLTADAAALYEEAARRYPGRLVLWGESLGTAVAVALAAARDVKALILEAPFASALGLAVARYPIFPVSVLMKDQFRSDLAMPRVRAPVLVMHGAQDRIVPIADGERLFGLVTADKKFVRFPAGGHNDLDRHGAAAAALDFLRGLDVK